MQDLPKRRYGQWGGNPEGRPYDQVRCAEQVQGTWLFHQCSRKKGHGRDGLFCKQHAKWHPVKTK